MSKQRADTLIQTIKQNMFQATSLIIKFRLIGIQNIDQEAFGETMPTYGLGCLTMACRG